MRDTMNIPEQLQSAEGGKVRRYQDLFIGRRGWGRLLLYELVQLLSTRVSGALGLFLRSKLYPLLLGECGRNVHFGVGVVLRHPHKIRIGDDVAVDDGCVLDAKGTGNDGIRIADGVFLGRNTIVTCKNGDIVLKEKVNVGMNCIVFSASRVVVGRNTLLAAFCYLVGGSHAFADVEVPVIEQERPSEGIEVGANSWFGAGVVVVDGVSVGDDCIVGANAVVTRDLPKYSVAVGVPARVVRDRREGS